MALPSQAVSSFVSCLSSLRGRLLLLVLLAVLAPFTGILYMGVKWNRHQANDAQERALHLVRHASAIHQRLIGESRAMLFSLAQLPAAVRGEKAALGDMLPTFLAQHRSHIDVGVIEPNGTILVSARTLAPATDVADRAFFRRAVETGGFAVGECEIDGRTGTGTLSFGYPILDMAGRVRRVLFSVMEFDWINELATEALLPGGTMVTVFHENGTVVAHEPDPRRWVGGSLFTDTDFQRLLSRAPEGAAEATSLDGVRRLFAVKELPGTAPSERLYVFIGIPTAVATAVADNILTHNLLGVVIAAGLGLALAWVGYDLSLLRQLKVLVTTTRRLSGGDMTARTGLPRRPGDVNELTAAVDEMAAALQQRQDAILRQDRRFRALIEKSSDGVALLDRDGTLRYASPSTTRILGHAAEDLIGRTAVEFIHPHDREQLRVRLVAVAQEPGAFASGTLRLRHANGSWRWIGGVVTNLLAEPSVQAIVANYTDITEWKQAEESLRKAHDELDLRVRERTSELQDANHALQEKIAEHQRAETTLRKLSRVTEQTGDSVVVTDCDGTIEYVNPSFETLTGFSRHEAIGANPRILKSGAHDQKFYANLWTTVLSGAVFRSVFTNRKKNGALYHEEQTITPIRDGRGQITHFVSTGRDITQRKRTEEALRRLNDQLEHEATRIAGVLHDEAGQFLTATHITLADVARHLPAPLQQRLHDARGNLDQIEEQLRRVSHELRPRILDDMGLVEAVRFLAESVALRAGMSVSVENSLEERCPPVVETALYRLIQEALTNITRHARASRATVVLKRDRQNIHCAIRDDGVGFDVAAVRARSGEPGAGLLRIQDRLEAVGGTFQIVSAVGRGTELLATIPVEP